MTPTPHVTWSSLSASISHAAEPEKKIAGRVLQQVLQPQFVTQKTCLSSHSLMPSREPGGHPDPDRPVAAADDDARHVVTLNLAAAGYIAAFVMYGSLLAEV